jgi:hypothetical protein
MVSESPGRNASEPTGGLDNNESEVERSAGSLIKLPSAVATPEDGVAEIGRVVQVPTAGRLAMRADHGVGMANSEYRTHRTLPRTSVLTLSFRSALATARARSGPVYLLLSEN